MKHHRAVVGIGIESSSSMGRRVLQGVMRFSNIRREWILAKEFNIGTTTPAAWPVCEGGIVSLWEERQLQALKKRCRHLLSVSGGADPAMVPVVSMDDFAIGRLAGEHLMECKLEHFGYYGWEPGGGAVSEHRRDAFRAVLAAQNFSLNVCPVYYQWRRQLGGDEKGHWPALIEWLRALPKPVGIFAVDDLNAHDLAAACVEADLHVPDEVAILGVNDDDLLCEGAWPPLSSVQCDFERIGYLAAELLHRLMRGESPTAAELCVRMPPLGITHRPSTDILAVRNQDIAAAMRFIRDHACDPCSVTDVLRQVPVGRRWLERNFVEQIGRTPYDAIQQIRIKRAQELLTKTTLGVQEIADECGFTSIRNFNHQFRLSTGESPAAFRRVHQAR
jgi:LacI family transcriptional regulator